MEVLREKIDNLKRELDKQEEVMRIRKLNQKIKTDKELKELIEQYRTHNSFSLVRKIEANKLFPEYKESETNLNILILKINQKLKEINEGNAKDESN